MADESCTGFDAEAAYESLLRVRRFEQAQCALWSDGLISGELHSGVGEEAVAVGVVARLRDGDAMALDHRGTPALVARGVDMRALLLESAGSDQGLCRGFGGHMHLVAADVLAVADGIVGSSGPMACGLAIAARQRPGAVAVAFFGEGAANQGMLLESWNLAVAWRLPVVFVCKDSRWAITTRSRDVTGGSLLRRARAFGMPAYAVDGWKVAAVARVASQLVDRSRAGAGPGLLLARVHRPDGHFAGDPMLRLLRDPLGEGRALAPGLLAAARATPGARPRVRVDAATHLARRFATFGWQQVTRRHDPVARARRLVSDARAEAIDVQIAAELQAVVDDVRSVLDATSSVDGAR